jgi:hypothetical protein
MQFPNTETEISCLQDRLEDLSKKIGDIVQQDLKFYEAKGLLHEIKFLKKKLEELRQQNN